METPTSLRQRTGRNPTPRLSERKRSLFAARKESPVGNSDSEQENYVLGGITPLNDSKNSKIKEQKMRSVEVLLARTPTRAVSFLKRSNSSSPERMDDDLFEKLPDSPPLKSNGADTPLRRSRRISLKPKNGSPPVASVTTSALIVGKENVLGSQRQKMMSDELPTLFTNSMNLNKNRKPMDEEEIIEDSSDDGSYVRTPAQMKKKRAHLPAGRNSPSSKSKIPRLDICEPLSIPTKSFYSRVKTSPIHKSPPIPIVVKRSPKYRRSEPRTSNAMVINKGVHHKIRKKPKHKVSSAVTGSKTNVVDILSTIQNERLRNLLTAKRQEKDQIENVHRIFKSGKNPIEMAKPLTAIRDASQAAQVNHSDGAPSTTEATTKQIADMSMGFSDIECSSESESEMTIAAALNEPQPSHVSDVDEELENPTPVPIVGRKFFKSGQSKTKKEIKITDNIRASMCNGKLSLMDNSKKKNRKLKIRNTHVNEFSSEQARVDEILKNFEDSICTPEEEPPKPVKELIVENEAVCPVPTYTTQDYEIFDNLTEIAPDEDEFIEFRNRLPYNTDQPELIEQQHILLDFLITNKICNEENFKIFIADPDNHKEEAQKIIDQLVVVVDESPDGYRQRIPYNTTDPTEIEQQKNFLEFLIENNICNEQNFEIFIADYANRHEEADRIITEIVAKTHNISAEDLERELNRFNNEQQIVQDVMEFENPDQGNLIEKPPEESSEKLWPVFYPGRCQPIAQQKSIRKTNRIWSGGYGSDQYQIDAGQKQFGARQCKQCGLVYTMHEPEEEKLHKEFHASLYILKFKSWIDEDIVQIYPEWGTDGRIIRITDSSHPKRQERLRDVLQLVDKELGFASYIMPKSFVAYFAIRQHQIVGVCLVQPLTKAHRYICMNGVDCCTEEAVDAKCGISRIWVSPLHRRFHIASKLIRAVQLYTIFGEEIPMDKIAFSAPTEDGKKFAKAVTKMEDFLVYQ